MKNKILCYFNVLKNLFFILSAVLERIYNGYIVICIIYYYIIIICIVNEQSCVLLINWEHDKHSKVNHTIKKKVCMEIFWNRSIHYWQQKATNLGRLYSVRLEI